MVISALQIDVASHRPMENITRIDMAVNALPASTDLIVLPEMFSTGFITEPKGIAEPADGETLQWMKATARKKDAALVGSLSVKAGDKYVNRCFFVQPHGEITTYDKHHLFSYGGENRHYTPGKDRVIVTYRGVRILLQICYDLRFPVFSRNHSDYDVAVYVANWPTSRISAWNTLLKARAIENQCYVVGCNRIGKDEHCTYNGNTQIINPYGETIAHCADHTAGVATAEIDMNALLAFRQKFPVLQDADSSSFSR
mgnify:FL=1